MTLAFFIRGASGNTSMSGLALSTVLAEQILFTIAYILLLDVSVILLRDIYYQVCLGSVISQHIPLSIGLQGKSPPEVTNMKTYVCSDLTHCEAMLSARTETLHVPIALDMPNEHHRLGCWVQPAALGNLNVKYDR